MGPVRKLPVTSNLAVVFVGYSNILKHFQHEKVTIIEIPIFYLYNKEDFCKQGLRVQEEERAFLSMFASLSFAYADPLISTYHDPRYGADQLRIGNVN